MHNEAINVWSLTISNLIITQFHLEINLTIQLSMKRFIFLSREVYDTGCDFVVILLEP